MSHTDWSSSHRRERRSVILLSTQPKALSLHHRRLQQTKPLPFFSAYSFPTFLHPRVYVCILRFQIHTYTHVYINTLTSSTFPFQALSFFFVIRSIPSFPIRSHSTADHGCSSQQLSRWRQRCHCRSSQAHYRYRPWDRLVSFFSLSVFSKNHSTVSFIITSNMETRINMLPMNQNCQI